MPPREEVVAEVHHEGRVAEELPAVSTAWARPSGSSWDVGDLRAERGAVAGGLADLVAGLGGDDDPDSVMPASTIASMP